MTPLCKHSLFSKMQAMSAITDPSLVSHSHYWIVWLTEIAVKNLTNSQERTGKAPWTVLDKQTE